MMKNNIVSHSLAYRLPFVQLTAGEGLGVNFYDQIGCIREIEEGSISKTDFT